jgi:ribonuclease PH
VQGTAEGEAVPRKAIDEMLDVGFVGIRSLVAAQRATLTEAGVDLDALLVGPTK